MREWTRASGGVRGASPRRLPYDRDLRRQRATALGETDHVLTRGERGAGAEVHCVTARAEPADFDRPDAPAADVEVFEPRGSAARQREGDLERARGVGPR